MPKQREPMLLSMRRSGLSLKFSLQGAKMTGLTVDYQEGASSGEVPQVMSMLNGVLSKTGASAGRRVGAIVEGMALLDPGEKLPGGKGTTLVDLHSSGLKMGMVMRERRVTGLTIDYQDVVGDSEMMALLKVLNDIASGHVYRKANGQVALVGVTGGSGAHPRKRPAVHALAHGFSADDKDAIVVKAVDASLGILGDDGKRAFLALLENKYGMKLGDVPARTRGFVGIMRENLGPTADEIEKEIVREIRKAVPVRGSSLSEAVEALREFKAVEEEATEGPEPEQETALPSQEKNVAPAQDVVLGAVPAPTVEHGTADQPAGTQTDQEKKEE